MQTPILVTGALGNVGSEVVRLLLERGEAVRAADIHVDALRERYGDLVESVLLDFNRPETFAPAFQGVEKMFLMRPPAISDVKRLILPSLEVGRKLGLRRVVFLSLIGAEKNKIVPHAKIEDYLLASGLEYTFLRASFFMQNLTTTHRAEIREHNEINVPAGEGKTSFIDVRDIAAVAALALCEPGHANKAYDLTGSEALDYRQVAERLSRVLGRNITYRSPSLLQFLLQQRSRGVPASFALVMTAIYATARFGRAARVSDDVPRLLGRAPISFQQFAEDHRDCWLD